MSKLVQPAGDLIKRATTRASRPEAEEDYNYSITAAAVVARIRVCVRVC